MTKFHKIFLFGILLFSSFAYADRIGNGGGVWACIDSNNQMNDLMFIDVFEARQEFQLNIPEINVPIDQYVQEKMNWLAEAFPQGKQININIQYVLKTVIWIEDILEMIPDFSPRVIPHPSKCKNGEWKTVQLVNYTNDKRVLARKDLFDSPMLTNLERAAVYFHEGIYSFLRDEYGDANSTRARAIVGYLLAEMPEAEKIQKIDGILKQIPPEIDHPVKSFVCGLKPEVRSPLYIFEAQTSEKASLGAVEACKKGENSSGHGIGHGDSCSVGNVYCEEVTSNEKKKVCSVSNFFHTKTYQGTGRTSLEAQKEAMNKCLFFEGADHRSCFDSSNMECP